MKHLHYLDNERSGFVDWTQVVQGGTAIAEHAGASFPERGAVGLRVTTNGQPAYAQKDCAHSAAPSGELYVGFWMCLRQCGPSGKTTVVKIATASDTLVLYEVDPDGQGTLKGRTDAAGEEFVDSGPLAGATKSGRWTYLVVGLHRAASAAASDGAYCLYADGVRIAHLGGVDNYDKCSGNILACVGAAESCCDGFIFDVDEVKVSVDYPQPYLPQPHGEYLTAARTVVLYRKASDASQEFADYCVEQLGLPRANLIPLPGAGASETLADLDAYNEQITSAIDEYFSLNSAVAARCMCFLVGYGVPGYFVHGGEKQAVTNWLMNYGGSQTAGLSNPLYAPATVSRLRRSQMNDRYLATRIDADSLAAAKGIVDRGLAVSSASPLPDADTLYTDDEAYRTSLSCQRLRIRTSPMGQLSDDAFTWAQVASPNLGEDGSRAAFASTAADAAASLRSGAGPCRTALQGGYAAALGSADDAAAFDAESFFEMLRIGGTFAEACCVAVAQLNHTACAAGCALMTVNFQRAGYNIYHGVGGPEDVDWTQPVAHLRPDAQETTIPLALAAGQKQVLGARAVSASGVEEQNTHVLACVQTAQAGELLATPLGAIAELTVHRISNQRAGLSFSHHCPPGFATAEEFEVFTDNGTGRLDLESPVSVLPCPDGDPRDVETLVHIDALPAQFAVRARKGEQTGPLSEIVTLAPAALSVPYVL